MDARIETIVRRTLAELRALDPGCDCAVLHGTRVLLALALDERVIPLVDASAAIDLVRFLELEQHDRRVHFGLDQTATDGPLHPSVAEEGASIEPIRVRLWDRVVPLAQALELLTPQANDG